MSAYINYISNISAFRYLLALMSRSCFYAKYMHAFLRAILYRRLNNDVRLNEIIDNSIILLELIKNQLDVKSLGSYISLSTGKIL